MRMTYTSFMQFYENVDMSMLWSICRHGGRKKVPRRWNKNGATATYPKMMRRQHIRKWCHDNISVPVARGDTGAKGSECERVMQDGGVIPVTGFPRFIGMANEEECAWSKRARCKHRVHLIQHMHSVHGRSSSRDYTFEACVFGAVRVVEGSSCSRRR